MSISALVERLTSDPATRQMIRRFTWSVAAAALVRVGGAGLGFFLMLLISRNSTTAEFGIFGSAYAFAVVLAFVGNIGQPLAVRRFDQQWLHEASNEKANCAIKLGLLIVSTGLLCTGLVLVATSLFINGSTIRFLSPPLALSIAALAFVFGTGQFTSTALRFRGYTVLALGPKDIGWRLLGCAALAVAWHQQVELQALFVLWLLTGLLMICVGPQVLWLLRIANPGSLSRLTRIDRHDYRRASTALWGNTLVNPMLVMQAGAMIIAIFISPREAGAYFAAERVAYLLSLSLFAVKVAAGPLMSRYYYAGDSRMLRLTASVSGILSGIASFAGLLVCILFADHIMALFDPAYTKFSHLLVILAIAQFALGTTGLASMLIQIAGYERVMLMIAFVGGAGALLGQLVAAFFGNLTLVAVAAAAGPTATALLSLFYVLQKFKIDTSGASHVYSTLIYIFFAQKRPNA